MAQFLLINDHMKHWLYGHVEHITGFMTSSTTTSIVIVNTVGITILNAFIVAIVSGVIGSIAAHYTKKLITKLENKHGKKRKRI